MKSEKLGAWGTPHKHLGAWAFSQIHAIGDMGFGVLPNSLRPSDWVRLPE